MGPQISSNHFHGPVTPLVCTIYQVGQNRVGSPMSRGILQCAVPQLYCYFLRGYRVVGHLGIFLNAC